MKLEAQKRNASANLAELRHAGMAPAVCYGPDMDEAIAISVDVRTFVKTYREAGTVSILDLSIDGEEHEVLIKDIERHPVSEDVLHVDFYAIKRGVEMDIAVPVELVGESPAVKSGAVLNQAMYELNVRCRPRAIPSNVEADISVLTEAGQGITVAELQLPEGVVATDAPEQSVVSVAEAKTEAEGGDAGAMAEVLAEPAADENA